MHPQSFDRDPHAASPPRSRPGLVSLAGSLLCAGTLYSMPVAAYMQTNLVSDIPGMALTTDPDLVNPWGVAYSPAGPFWVSDNGTGLSTLYTGSGSKLGLVVTIPPAGGAAPTGQVLQRGVWIQCRRVHFCH